VYLTFESLVHCVFLPGCLDFVKSMLRRLSIVTHEVNGSQPA
jgi:hypothetical protein